MPTPEAQEHRDGMGDRMDGVGCLPPFASPCPTLPLPSPFCVCMVATCGAKADDETFFRSSLNAMRRHQLADGHGPHVVFQSLDADACAVHLCGRMVGVGVGAGRMRKGGKGPASSRDVWWLEVEGGQCIQPLAP